MRLRGRQARFLAVTLCLWSAARTAMLWPHLSAPVAAADRPPAEWAMPSFRPAAARGMTMPQFEPWPDAATPAGWHAAPRPADPALMLLLAMGAGAADMAPQVALRHVTFASEPDEEGAPPIPLATLPIGLPSIALPPPARDRRLSVEAYLFTRQGSRRALLSPEGQLGGSQMALRAAYAIDPAAPVRIDLAARAYLPLKGAGAEAAAGIDVHPARSVPLRLSLERRQRLDHAGRSAWSAYAASGFYREDARRGLILDGYAQTGIVGFRRGDLFVDGAARAGIRVGDALAPVVGAGVWGAAQPGVARLDVGPRAVFTLPVADHALSLGIEGRIRIAGDARPGSGLALTLAAAL